MRGFSTIEILVAFAVAIAAITPVALLSSGAQSALADSSARNHALQRAQALFDAEAGNTAMDFRLADDMATTTDGMYQGSLSVTDYSPDPYTTKRVTAIVAWKDRLHASHQVSLAGLLSDFGDPSTLDTCDPEVSGNWETPSTRNYALAPGDLLPSNAPPGHAFSPTNTIAGADAYKGRLYVSVLKKAAAADDSLFAFAISDPLKKPAYLGSIDTNASVTGGPSFVLAAGDYLYAADNHVSNFKSCKPSANCAQLQVFSAANPAAISPIANFLLPTSSMPFVTGTTTGQAVGNTLAYKDGYGYLGLTKTATGPEFNIIDMRDPSSPKWTGGYQVGATINRIYVRDRYAYLADDDKSREFIVLDVSDPTNPRFVSSFDPKGTLGYEVGESEYLRGNTLFAGMSAASGSPELYALGAANPSSLSIIGSHAAGSTLLGLFARDNFLFMLASTVSAFQMLDISNQNAPIPYGTSTRIPGTGAALDCEGNYFFAGSNSGSQGFISIIGPSL